MENDRPTLTSKLWIGATAFSLGIGLFVGLTIANIIFEKGIVAPSYQGQHSYILFAFIDLLLAAYVCCLIVGFFIGISQWLVLWQNDYHLTLWFIPYTIGVPIGAIVVSPIVFFTEVILQSALHSLVGDNGIEFIESLGLLPSGIVTGGIAGYIIGVLVGILQFWLFTHYGYQPKGWWRVSAVAWTAAGAISGFALFLALIILPHLDLLWVLTYAGFGVMVGVVVGRITYKPLLHVLQNSLPIPVSPQSSQDIQSNPISYT